MEWIWITAYIVGLFVTYGVFCRVLLIGSECSCLDDIAVCFMIAILWPITAPLVLIPIWFAPKNKGDN